MPTVLQLGAFKPSLSCVRVSICAFSPCLEYVPKNLKSAMASLSERWGVTHACPTGSGTFWFNTMMFQTSTCMSVCMSICIFVCSGACLHRCTFNAHSTHTYMHTQHTHHTIMYFPHNCSSTKSLSNSRAETSELLGRISTL